MQAISCSQCGFESPEGFAFCGGCGARLAAKPQEPGPAGERRTVAVLFVDLKGYTSLSETLDAERVHEVMNRWFEGLTRCVQEQDGHVDKYIGDCLMALFGAPVAHEDDPVRAVRAALGMQEWTRRFAADLGDRFSHLKARVGVHLGEVIAGDVGGRDRFDYSVMGDTVNVASRLESAAEPGTVLVSERIQSRTRHAFEFEGPQHLELKGKSEPVPAYRLVAERETPASDRGLEGRTARLVGRERELSRVQNFLADCAEGSAGVLSLVAEAGVGKSRLLAEAESRRPRNLRWLQITCQPRWKEQSYSVFRDLLQQTRSRLEARADWNEWSPFLAPLLQGDTEETRGWDPVDGRRLLRRSLQWAASALSDEAPVVLVVDDYHWCDDASRAVLAELRNELGRQPLGFLLAHRPDVATPWAPQEAAARIELSALSSGESLELLASLFPDLEWTEQLRSQLLDRSGGNPLFLEETLRSLLEMGAIARDETGWVLRNPGAVPIPDSLRSLLMARIDRLTPPARQWLLVASVLRGDVRADLVSALIGCRDDAAAILSELQGARLVEEGSSPGILRFSHPMVRGVAYESMLLRDRGRWHGRVGRELERSGQQDRESLEQLAHHFSRSDDVERCVRYALLAGEREIQICETEAARRYFQLALDTCRTLAEEEALLAERRARAGLCEVHMATANFEEALLQGEKAQACLPPGARGVEAGRLYRLLGLAYAKRGDPRASLPWFETSLHALTPPEDAQQVTERARCLLDRAWACYRLGEYDAASALIDEGASAASGSADLREAARAQRLRAQVLWAQGLREGLEEELERSIRLCESVKDPAGVASAWNMLGNLAQDRGELDRAETCYRRAVELWERLGHVTQRAGGLNNMAVLLMGRGRLEEAQQLYEESLQLALRHEDHFAHAMARANLGFLALESGQETLAEIHLKHGLEESRERGFTDLTAYLLCGLGECALQRGRDEAESHFEQALDLSRQIGKSHLVALATRGLGKLDRRSSRPADAERRLVEALELFQSIGHEHEAGRTCLELARLHAGTRPERASEYLGDAEKTFEQIRAQRDLERARALRADLASGEQVADPEEEP